MNRLLLLLLSCYTIYAAKHSVIIYFTGSSGLNLPDFMAVEEVDGNQVAYCNSNGTLEPRQDWMKKMYDNDPQLLKRLSQECFEIMPSFFRLVINSLKNHLNQSRGVHVVQRIGGCEWYNETGELTGILQYGYNGKDFITFDLNKMTWIALSSEAGFLKTQWDSEQQTINLIRELLTQTCRQWLQRYFDHGRDFLLRTDLPSVSLLQKTPSSPVSCHATSFYPNSALMFWRKDGEEIHEDVNPGEILYNQDGTFQIGVDLDVSSLKLEDWGRYDCVFHFAGVEDKIITKLDKDVIRTNRNEKGLSEVSIATIAAIAVLIAIIITVFGLTALKKKNDGHSLERSSTPPSDTVSL